jgi:hypothetical protein
MNSSTRSATFTRQFAVALANAGVRTTHVSYASTFFATTGSACMTACNMAPNNARTFLLTAAAMCVQLCLFCNVIDGLIA